MSAGGGKAVLLKMSPFFVNEACEVAFGTVSREALKQCSKETSVRLLYLKRAFFEGLEHAPVRGYTCRPRQKAWNSKTARLCACDGLVGLYKPSMAG